MSFGATDFVGRLLAGPLEAELKVVESGGQQLINAFLVERKAGSDHVNVESSSARGLNERGKIGAGQWFPPGEVELHDTEFGGLAEDAGPGIGRQFVRARGKFLRIGAVDAVQGAPVSEFGDERERIGNKHQIAVLRSSSRGAGPGQAGCRSSFVGASKL